MGYRDISYKGGSPALRRFLENVIDAPARAAAVSEGAEALVEIVPAGKFHSAEGFSPAAGIAVDPAGRIWVSDEFNHRLLVYGPDFALIRTVVDAGFRYPRGLAADSDGNVYVADSWNHRIAVVGPDGVLKGSFGKLGTGPGGLDEPCGVAFCGGLLAVLEKSNHRVQFFDTAGNSRGSIGRRGTVAEHRQMYVGAVEMDRTNSPLFEFPSGIAAGPDGGLYVADTNNHRVVKVRADGVYDSTFVVDGVRYPVGVACDAAGNLHVIRFNAPEIEVYSPASALLYRYVPAGVELPGAVAIAGDRILVAASMKPAVGAFSVSAEHGASAALEAPFVWNLKMALAAFSAGEGDDGARLLDLAGQCAPPDGPALAGLLPEDDFPLFQPVEEAPPGVETFYAQLEGAASALWSSLEALIARKADEGADMAGIFLREEKGLLAGTDIEPHTVARFRASRTMVGAAEEIKQVWYGLIKTDEMMFRLSRAGVATGRHIQNIAARLDAIVALKADKARWFASAAKEAPALSFTSLPDERAAFCAAEARVDAVSYEFRLLWGMAARGNFNFAALMREGAKGVSDAAFGDYLEKASLFAVTEPEYFTVRREYFLSLEALAESAGPARMAAYLAARRDAARWTPLGREDNIPADTLAPVYHLLPALWAGPGAAGDVATGADPWERINAFYLGEFRKFIAESGPMRTELVRQGQTLSQAEKADPKQAALIRRKLSLLRFHLLLQERYIGNLMAEYAVRFALFTATKPPVRGEGLAATAASLEGLITEASLASSAADVNLFVIGERIGKTEDFSEKRELRLLHTAEAVSVEYHLLLCAHLVLLRRAVGAVDGKPFPRRRFSLHRTAGLLRRFHLPTASRFDENGNIHVLSWNAFSRFGQDGNPISVSGAYAEWSRKSGQPRDIAATPAGEMLACPWNRPILTRFNGDGAPAGMVKIKIGDRQPYHLQVDEKGNIYVSFFDGNGFNICAPDGALIKEIPLKGSAFAPVEDVKEFLYLNGLLYAGGKGKVVAAAPGDATPRYALDTGVPFNTVTGFCHNGKGDIFFCDYFSAGVFQTDGRLSSFRRVPGINVVGPATVAARDGQLAVCDFRVGRVIVCDLPG